MLLWLQCEGVDVDAWGLGDVGVILVWLDQVEVPAGLCVEPIVAVQLQLGLHEWIDGLSVDDRAVVARVVSGRVDVWNDDPDQFFNWMVKVQPELVGTWVDGLGTCELDLLDQVLVGDLCKTSPFVRVEVNIVHPEGGVSQAPAGHGHDAATAPGCLHQEV